MKKVATAILLLLSIPLGQYALADTAQGRASHSHSEASADSQQKQAGAAQHAGSTAGSTQSSQPSNATADATAADASPTAHAGATSQTPPSSKAAASSPDAGKADSHKGDDDKASAPALSPTGYVEALLPALSVARDLGHNCQTALANNASDKKICDQFERSLNKLAARQKDIEATTPRPKDTSSIRPALMKEFNAMQDELKKETAYLRAYRDTQ